MKNEMKITELFDTSHTIAAHLFEGKTHRGKFWPTAALSSSWAYPAGEGVPQDRKISGCTEPRMAPPSRSADRPSSAPEPASVSSCVPARPHHHVGEQRAALWATPA